MRTLVTGAAGFIGFNLLTRLIDLGAEVIALDDFSTGPRERLKNLGVEIINANVCMPNLSSRLPKKVDMLFHFGAPCSVIQFNKEPEKMMLNTINGFIAIMKTARTLHVRKVVYPSSGSVYGYSSPPQSEMDTPQPSNLYAVGKLQCENIASLIQDVNSVGLRIFAGFGPGEEHKGEIASPVTLFLKSMLANQAPVVFGDGSQSRDFVYIDDVVESILRVSIIETPPILNVGSGHVHTFNEVINLLNQELDKNIAIKYVPKPNKYLERTQSDITLLKEILHVDPLDLKTAIKRYLRKIHLMSG